MYKKREQFILFLLFSILYYYIIYIFFFVKDNVKVDWGKYNQLMMIKKYIKIILSYLTSIYVSRVLNE